MNQYINQADQMFAAAQAGIQGVGSGSGGGGSFGAPMVTAKRGSGPESFDSFLKRYRETGAVNPRRENVDLGLKIDGSQLPQNQQATKKT